MSPELAVAYHRLYDVVWNQVGTVDIGMDGYNGISYDDTSLIDEAAAEVERLLVAESTATPMRTRRTAAAKPSGQATSPNMTP